MECVFLNGWIHTGDGFYCPKCAPKILRLISPYWDTIPVTEEVLENYKTADGWIFINCVGKDCFNYVEVESECLKSELKT